MKLLSDGTLEGEEMKKKSSKGFWLGILIATCLTIAANIMVTSMYRWIDGDQGGNNILTFVVSIILFAIIFYGLYKKINEG